MSAVATAPRSGRETIFAEQGSLLQPDINLNAPRYFVQFGFNVVSVLNHGIPNAQLWRGDIVPCRTVAIVDNYYAIPETERIPGSEVTGADGRLSVASRRSYAYHEAEYLLAFEDKTEKKNCVFEVRSLRSELGDRVYREIDLTRLFSPTWPDLPEKTVDVVKMLEDRAADLTPPAGIPSELRSQVMMILEGVGNELIQAARRTQEIQRAEILYTHQCMRMRPEEERFKARYDSRDYEILLRTGLPQVDAVELQTAESLNILAKQSTSNDSAELVAEMKEQNRLKREELDLRREELEFNRQMASKGKPGRPPKQPAEE